MAISNQTASFEVVLFIFFVGTVAGVKGGSHFKMLGILWLKPEKMREHEKKKGE